MALFEYECIQCGHTVEIIQSSNKPNPECEKCRGETRRLLSGGNFHLKGGGWAADGYAKKE